MIHSLNQKKKKEQQNKQNNRQQIKIVKISYPKLLLWRFLGQQFGRVERQQCQRLFLWGQKDSSSYLDLYSRL